VSWLVLARTLPHVFNRANEVLLINVTGAFDMIKAGGMLM
jgi:hypothetical protein